MKYGQTALHSGEASPTQITSFQSPTTPVSTSSTLAAVFSLGSLSFTSQNIKPAKLTLTPHHLFYLLSRFEELGIAIGPMNVRLENLHADISPGNYVSFLSQSQRSNGRSDRDSIHSISSVRSVMSGMSSLWSNLGIGSAGNAAKTEKAKAQLQLDLKYLYSAFTKIPCLRLSPDRKARLIGGYEEFPFDTAVPLLAFKNISTLEICDVDFRQFFGWDKLAEQLRSLSLKRASVDDPTDVLIGIVLDDMDKRRRRSSKTQSSPNTVWPSTSSPRCSEFSRARSAPGSPVADIKTGKSSSPQNSLYLRGDLDLSKGQPQPRTKSNSPTRPTSSRQGSSYRHVRGNGGKIKRSGSGSSTSSSRSNEPMRTQSSSNLLSIGILPASKWRFLKHLSLADNGLTSIGAAGLAPLANTLHSFDLSSNLFSEVPDCLASLTALRALNLSNCMIESLHSLARNPLPAISALNLRANRLGSIAGIERLLSLERLDLRDNRLTDPTEMARLTGIPDIREIWVIGNPLVKTHASYRVTILNLFRGTPGYTEDIIIDAAGPGYSERRQLRDRIAETEGVLVVKPLPVESDLAPNTTLHPALKPVIYVQDRTAELYARPLPHSTQSEFAVGSSRRRKGPRRRIVDLSIDESRVSTDTKGPLDVSNRKPHIAFADVNKANDLTPRDVSPGARGDVSRYPQEVPSRQSREEPPIPDIIVPPVTTPPNEICDDKGLALAYELQGLNLNGEAYRRKVEALKEEFGSGWLNVLSKEDWDGRETSEIAGFEKGTNQVTVARPKVPDFRAADRGILSSGRTLG